MDASIEREEQLLSDYNFWRAQTHHLQKRRSNSYVRNLKLGRTKHVFSALIKWCGERDVDPRRFLYFRFKSRHWLFPPPLNQLIPAKRSEQKALREYRDMGAVPAYDQRCHDQRRYAQDSSGVVWDINRDICHLAEAVKRRYLATDDWQRCMDRMSDQTYGYHPKSRVCARCPAAAQCIQKLQAGAPFDIVALRRGEVSLQSCYVIANRS